MMSKVWYLLGMISQVATKEAFQFIPPVRYVLKTTNDHDLRHPKYARCNPCRMSGGTLDDGKAKPTSDDPSLGVKAAWYGSELFGNIIGLGKSQESTARIGDPSTRISRADAAARLKSDFDRYYFVTGAMDLDLYEEDCTFADPFVAFEGRQRFKSNLDNLGSLMQDVSLDVTSWEEEENSIKTKWKFRCVLGLPWKPTLAAAGGTEFFFNQSSGRIERHVESWEIEPIDALKQLIRPGRKKSSR
ncbi:unnamed protein product [Ascophyllum nodosum]